LLFLLPKEKAGWGFSLRGFTSPAPYRNKYYFGRWNRLCTRQFFSASSQASLITDIFLSGIIFLALLLLIQKIFMIMKNKKENFSKHNKAKLATVFFPEFSPALGQHLF
jgi:hypothetical protein